ncbi:hypothetical protein A3K01_01835 [candidate division WWE3 bacterium RIFOXYD1_FULL_43_17]|uniref:Prepilin-type N-terminal cleavage/methylation domain-containing protein n=3 Tax=Katanobacteria TaxID=422282 RepID=A0A1F4XBI4_UNCKA|nr:MAG: MSHA biogenesis protein MshO [candidate division WWE3 bacterium GW2011_GWE1_41_27]KKS60323.1 MAG: MSHA biogenesis protein MshO [candidate division WWE3 bacterium GW2011_GWF2_42_42]OGC79032.1 MAG: hypothetical protein A3K01_01835 [candidate division WWE3 bacterium RIFOXYD1_FULL_43_17]
MKKIAAVTDTTTQNKGFTLVELLVVIALLGISVGVTNDILVSLVRSYSKTQIKNEIEQQANFVGLKLERELRSAESVVPPTVPPYTSRLVILKGGGVSVTYELVGDVLKVQNPTGSAAVALTSKDGVSGVSVTCGLSSGTACFSVTGSDPQTVVMNIKLQAVKGNAKEYSEIVNAITIRKSY